MGRRLPNPAWWRGLLSHPWLLYPLFLYGLGCYLLVTWPIVKLDTDLWFHLSWGRYLFEHHAIPSDSFFSFLSPPRPWVDYAWLFQALVYLCHSHAGYYGLIGVRSVVWLATFGLIFLYLFKDQDHASPRAWRAFIFALVWLILIPRHLFVRPFLFTYFFIVVFLYLLELYPRRAMWLLPLGILWCNLHGISYPFLFLITGSYSLEYLWRRFRGKGYSAKDERLFFVPVVLSMATVFLTPHGLELLNTPFRDLGYLSHYVSELLLLRPDDLLSFEIVRMAPSFRTTKNVLLLVTTLAVVVSCVNRRVRISHLLMCVTGLVLVTKGPRFVVECSLLALPLLKATPLIASGALTKRLPAPVTHVVAGFLMVMPVMFAATLFGNRPAYPFSHRGLPEGIVTFLNRVDAGGNVLNSPGNGGYLRWGLYPKYRIFIDMEALFTDEDLYLAKHAFLEREPLRKVLTQYDPSFITVPGYFGGFRELIAAFPHYVLVFFDEAEVLYVNRRHYPAIAQAYELKGLDPFELMEQPAESLLAEDNVESLLRSLSKLSTIYPDGSMAHRLAAVQYTKDGAYDRALTHAEALISTYPGLPEGYRLKGDALKGLGFFDEALLAYRMALKRLDPESRRDVYRAMGLTHLEMERYANAYTYLSKAIDIFSAHTTLEDLYHLGSAARLAGKPRVAKAALTYLYQFRVSPDDAEWIERLRTDLADLGVAVDEGGAGAVKHQAGR